ncbi:RagB/SusD family nutrient uptake outer membrane protein [Flavivirga spongiicola]|uniref:RagB/SusD family nutrient uptake outer membrane protein n=1 Tax=Flavivirga spongiicola TaxID=421621 RepID=A0ABU7XWV3_9FLAO|nr:RagB/SusD family nutrient uptake outer membrane protein [Flavivirga sp. MEBiC05379]MDO5980038.1 RagB/SusD family nutrient uptake outer membrane protein [Flavivirga sp. MEBiC05379]
MKTKFKNTYWLTQINQQYKFVLCAIILGLLSVSCEKELEEEVFSAFTGDNFYTDVASAELGLFGVYDVLGTEDLYGRGYLLYYHTSTDQERYWRQGRGQDDDLLSNYQIQESNAWVGRVWSRFYDGINRVNLLIDRVIPLRDQAEENQITSDLDAYNTVLGDAYFLRAFMYFQLVKNWGDVPLRLESDITLADLQIERSPKVNVYQQIESDMLKAIPLLPNASQVSTPGRINKGAAQAILARIYLTWAGHPIQDTSKYEKAAEQAWAVISSGEHELNSVIENPAVGAPFDHPFPEVFKNLSENVYDLKESMWEIHFSYIGDDRFDASTVGVWHGITQHTRSTFKRGAPRRHPLPTFLASFEADDTARRDWSIAQFEINSSDNFIAETNELTYGVGKFRRYLIPTLSPNNNYDVMNWPIVRYADVLLMLAESVNETLENGGALPGGISLSSAYDAINQVRRRARMLDPNSPDVSVDLTGGAGETFRQQIRNERSWELCFENQRRPDLVRWGILEETVRQAGVDLAADGVDVAADYFPAAEVQSKHVLFPIPFAAEISQNPAILNTDPTNNGYR